MIHCPKCGTPNPRGSRFCKECGEPLPLRTALRCPMCSTMNPVGNVYCDMCQARLIPMAAPRSEEPEREQPPLEEPSPAIPPSEEEGEGQEAADWLGQLRASAMEESEVPDTLEEPVEPVEIPDWLREMGPVGADTGTQPPEEPPFVEPRFEEETQRAPSPAAEEAPGRLQEPAPADLPDWLREIAPPEAETPSKIAPPEAEAPPSETAPPTAEAPPEEAAPAAPAPAPAEVPDWLHEIAPPEAETPLEAAPPTAEAPPEEAAPAAPAPAEVPDWLREIAPPEAEAPSKIAPPEEETPLEAAPPTVEAPPEEAAPAAPVPAPAEVPDWLREIAPPEAEAPPSEAAPPTAEAPPEEAAPAAPVPAPAEVPDWLREIAPPEAETPLEAAPPIPALEGMAPALPTEPGIEIGKPEELAPAAIPDWLEALRPRPEAVTEVAEEEPVETEGLLAGLRGVLPAVPAFQVPSVREEARPPEAREASIARAQLLQSLLARPAEAPQVKAGKQGISMGERIQRWLVAAVLLTATVAVLIAPTIPVSVPTLTQPVISSGVTRAHETIQDIGIENSVLVAFEYGPSEADELNLVAEPILRHLLDQGAQISVVSTRPQGLAVAEGLLSTIGPSDQRYPRRYKPGDATGVSNLLADAGNPSLIFVVTARPGPLRWWVEQARSLPDEPPPVVGGVSAALESAASPYLDANAGQITGAIHGLSGAAAYEALRSSPGQAHRRLNTLALGHAAIVGLMILGAAFYTLGGLHGRAK